MKNGEKRKSMALNLNEIKEELSSDEKLLAQAFELEKFYKKHKRKIFTTLIILIVAIISYNGYHSWQEYKLNKANSALLTLQKNPNDSKALKILKENNPKLYELFSYSTLANNQDKKLLELHSNDAMLSDLITYHQGVLNKKPKDSIYYHDLTIIERAYLLIKANKKKDAQVLLQTLSKTSPLYPVAKLYMHYTSQ